MKPSSFLRGALIIALAGIASRVLGAFYRPIITHLFAQYDGHHGELGTGLTLVPQSSYFVMLSLTSVGVNIAISRMVAERVTLGDYRGALRVFHVSLWLMAVLGLTLSGLFFLAAPWLAGLTDYPEATPGFYAMAPAIMIVSVYCTFRGFFQGLQEMAPTAASQVLEQLTRILTGMVLVSVLAPVGINLGAAGANFGAVTGAVVALGYLVYRFVRHRDTAFWEAVERTPPEERRESVWALVGKLLAVATPISLLGISLPLVTQVDALLVKVRLAEAGILGDEATAAFGQLGNATTFINLPLTLAAALFVALVPSITEAVTVGRMAVARERAEMALRITILVGLPASAGLWLMPEEIYGLIFPSQSGGPALQALAWATLFLMLLQTASGVLQGTGSLMVPVVNFLVGLSLKAGLTYWWTAMPEFGVQGAGYATVVGFGVSAALNVLAIVRRLELRFSVPDLVLRPGLAVLGMAAALLWLAPRLGGNKPGIVFTLVAGGLIYMVSLAAVGGVRLVDLEGLGRPGRRLASLLRRLKG